MIVAGLALLAAPARAQQSEEGLGFGARTGFGLEPDQFVIGAQVGIGKTISVARIVPSVDVGFGNSVTTVAFNADLIFRLRVEDTRFAFYGGGGPTVALFDASKGGSSWEVGGTAVAGVSVPVFRSVPTNVEARFGIGDIPDFRLLVAFMFS